MATHLSGRDTYTLQNDNSQFAYSFLPGTLFVALLWLIHLLSYLTEADLAWLGVLPRNFFGLIGVITGPLIHGDLLHLLSNTFPLVLLSGFILFMHRQGAVRVIVLVYVLSGLLNWLIGRQAYHVGASGVVYGMVGFLLFNGFLRHNRGAMAISLAVLFLYSGLFYGLFPSEERVSWEGHIAGLLSGLVAVFVYGDARKERDNEPKVLEPGVVQRHVSNTLGSHYQHMHIGYEVKDAERSPTSYTYLFDPGTGAAHTPTKQAAVSSKKRSYVK
ncbi:MAG: rhomboid family intramembrane serine protease [Hymenobacteraceae bacterium]|nr:rhomboid family intramembrane serine protease [Hymenobacteraceae bacterium]MDX5483341.1 rhomboid family intramembrane serine protease [Hymenobacteraceae bacterium]